MDRKGQRSVRLAWGSGWCARLELTPLLWTEEAGEKQGWKGRKRTPFWRYTELWTERYKRRAWDSGERSVRVPVEVISTESKAQKPEAHHGEGEPVRSPERMEHTRL